VLASLILMIFPLAMTFAAANDLFTMKIPNRISLALVAGFVVIAIITRMPLETLGLHAAVALAVLVATFILFSLNMLGGGDAKLMAAGALWMGPMFAFEYLAWTTIFGGILALLILAYRNLVPATVLPLPPWAMRLHTAGGAIPYGIAIAAAGLVVFPHTSLFHDLMA
jgi:prepilin peptidase CpaA